MSMCEAVTINAAVAVAVAVAFVGTDEGWRGSAAHLGHGSNGNGFVINNGNLITLARRLYLRLTLRPATQSSCQKKPAQTQPQSQSPPSPADNNKATSQRRVYPY